MLAYFVRPDQILTWTEYFVTGGGGGGGLVGGTLRYIFLPLCVCEYICM